jgi:murein DD-endopeptidase MepM/ murein hydrolase activator NlpD
MKNTQDTITCTLSYNSSKVQIGQCVNVGEEIARVGMTGFAYLPRQLGKYLIN